jgi:hypothetical protein
MKSSNTRRPLHQQTAPEQKGPFFSKANDDAKKKGDVFFQTKLAVGEPGDKHEQEADKVADKVQKKTEEKEKPDVQKKGEDKDKETDKNTAGPAAALPMTGPKSTAPDMAHKDKTPANKDATGGNAKHGKDEAADRPAVSQAAAATATDHKDKAPDPKSSAGQASSTPKDKLPGQGAAGQMTPKDEEPKMVSRKEAEREKEPAVQKMSSGDKKEEDKTKVSKKEDNSKQEKDEPVMKKESGSGAHGAHKVSLEERIKHSKGKGQTLPDDVRDFLESQLGADFGEVVIHTDSEAVALNKELNALAFTSGFDIFFNAGQYKPGTAAGQKLLAHELTHVIQQTGVSKKKNKK